MSVDPNILGLIQRAIAAHQAGNLAEAEPLYKRVLAVKPDQFEALHFLGLLEAQSGRLEEADRLISRSLTINRRMPEAFANHARVLYQLKRHTDSLASADKALALKPMFLEALIHRGNALQELCRYEDALAAFDRALTIRPNDAMALVSRGNALKNLRRDQEAMASYERAIALRPNFPDALNNGGMLLMQIGRYAQAAECFQRLLQIDPASKYALGLLIHSKMHICDWDGLAAAIERMRAGVLAGQRVTDPSAMVACTSDPSEQRRCAEIFVADTCPAGNEPLWRGARSPRDRIRIAYVCGELRAHATSFLMAEVFERHDRARFETFAMSTGFDDGSAMRKRVEAAFDVFTNASRQSDGEIAEFLCRSEIDIAVDLNGHFGTGRPKVFALRPCPIQANYLGCPGTFGANYIDYIIADNTVIPPDQQSFYSEKVVYLPDQYQANDTTRRISDHTPTRVELGLPERGFVFCCFNNNYKISPDIFGIWMQLLRHVDGSVLWLLEGNEAVTGNLRREAARRGIAEDRIVFAPRMNLEAHLARHRLADLFLDTLPFNAHTTASDALWAGLPVVTCLGTTFAGRVAASLLRAVGLDDLVTRSLADYEALALRLANDPAQLGAIKARLAQNRQTHPLFDARRFTRHIEQAYVTMWERHRRGEPPASFAVDPIA